MKYEWGKYTWYLFHALAEKMNDKYFDKAYVKIIDWVKLICFNLPCPYCSEHATRLLNNYKLYNKIKNKENLKQFFFEFHNIVNKKTKKTLEETEILNKYKDINFNKLLILWNEHFILNIHDLHYFKKKNDILLFKKKLLYDINKNRYLFT